MYAQIFFFEFGFPTVPVFDATSNGRFVSLFAVPVFDVSHKMFVIKNAVLSFMTFFETDFFVYMVFSFLVIFVMNELFEKFPFVANAE